MAAALRPRAFRLCGELAQAAISWMCPLPYIRDVAAPALIEGASIAGRDKPAMIVHVPVVVSDDRDTVVAAAGKQFGRYQTLPFYQRMMLDAGLDDATGKEFTPAMADALIISGTESDVGDRIRALPDFGADEMLATLVMLGDDPKPAAERTLALLGELARSA